MRVYIVYMYIVYSVYIYIYIAKLHLIKNQTYAKTIKVVFGKIGHSFLLAAAQHNHVEIKVWTHVQSDHGARLRRLHGNVM